MAVVAVVTTLTRRGPEPDIADADAGARASDDALPADPVEPPAVAAVTPTQRPAPSPPRATRRYRVTLAGVHVSATTRDAPDNSDGVGDEIAAIAIALYFERSGISHGVQPTLRGLHAVRTVEYGDINALRKDPMRLRAGNAAEGGGLAVPDVVPDGFTPGGLQGEPAARAFPLRVWEGTLQAGTDGVLIVPSLWERDVSRARFDAYVNGWLEGSKTEVLRTADNQVPVWEVNVVQAFDTAPLSYTVAELAAQELDRPLGLTPGLLGAEYHDRFIVLTYEKLEGLSAGSYLSLPLQYSESAPDPAFGHDYRLELRIERLE